MFWKSKAQNEDEIIVRQANPSDARGIISCMQSVMDERKYLVSEYYLLTERGGEQERIRNPDDLTLVCEHRKEIVGVLTVQRGGMYRKNRHVGGTMGIAIKAGYRHRGGLGTRMITEAIEWCRKQGILKLNLEVFSSNTNAISLYEKIGFEREGVRRKQFIIDGEYVDDILMTYWTMPEVLNGGVEGQQKQ